MQIHPVTSWRDGNLTVSLQAQFIGDDTDAKDKKYIASYGDQKVNLAGNFTDPADPKFSFSTGAVMVMAGLITDMHTYKVEFVTSLPSPQVGKPIPLQGSLQVVTPDVFRAATIWKEAVVARIQNAMNALRAKPEPQSELPNAKV